MKHTLITLLSFTFMFSCYQGPTVEFDDEKSQAVAAIFDAYMANDMQGIGRVFVLFNNTNFHNSKINP